MTTHNLSNPFHLEPCPFCGRAATLSERHGEGYSSYGRFWYSVGCGDCDVSMDDREEWDENYRLTLPPMECVERWNKRAAAKGEG